MFIINFKEFILNSIPRCPAIMTEEQAEQLNPLVLAFIGDSVETLYVRSRLVFKSDMKTGGLHKQAAKIINATQQSRAADMLSEFFNEKEKEIYKRARNSKTHTSAKNATIIDYKKASGYEAVIGYLYLTGQSERLDFLFRKVINYDN